MAAMATMAQELDTPSPSNATASPDLFANATSSSGAMVMPSATVFNATATSYSFMPSPTTSVLTHFPTPAHTASSSSMMSSSAPSQSAPFPDDTIGKYGRLHINAAVPSSFQLPVYPLFISFCLLILLTL
ncbi:uncharacterized protein BYT42DRAFT_614862 [Radiomyces spectabilis]|uniref:uncharacterized protein n=1 Tax=Radiomyces spectabilis TaxID=64574 RepID=UPI002220083D|nr:uncharacterized protein BYT42DRAFT_614862 [Radiomyces spectabilis]KAI8376074.1 hypothetical protein BYT42DRAFT_614862 [Radiomyces spectabilis]